MLSIFTGATSFGSLLYEGVPKMSLSVTHLLVLGHDQVRPGQIRTPQTLGLLSADLVHVFNTAMAVVSQSVTMSPLELRDVFHKKTGKCGNFSPCL